MAHNIPPREPSKRQPQKKIYTDYVCEKNSKTKNPTPAKARNKYKQKFDHKEYDTSDKLLPLSQPLITLSQEERSKARVALKKSDINPVVHVNKLAPNTALPAPAAGKPTLALSEDNEPVSFVNPPSLITPENVTSIEQITFADQKIEPDLPEFKSVDIIPNKPYNGIDGHTLAETIMNIYEDSLNWKKNLFKVPTGHCGRDFVKLISEWLGNFVTGNTFRKYSK